MAKSDIIASLKLNSTDYEQKLAKAKESTRKFSKDGGQGLTDMVGKFKGLAVAVAGSKAAMEVFNRVIKSSQTIGDEYAKVIDSAKSVTNQFFYAISNGDFTYFDKGLREIIKNAREASRALDDLGTNRIVLGYLRDKYQADFRQNLTIAKDKSLSLSERQSAYDAALRSKEAFATQVAQDEAIARGALRDLFSNEGITFDVSDEQLDRVLENYHKLGDVYKEAYDDIVRLHTVQMNLDNMDATYRNTYKGQKVVSGYLDKIILINKKIKANEELYKDAQVYNVAFEKWQDETLQGNLAILQGAKQSKKELSEWTTQTYEVANQLNQPIKAGTVGEVLISPSRYKPQSLGSMAGIGAGTGASALPVTLEAVQPVILYEKELQALQDTAVSASEGLGALGNAFGNMSGMLGEGAGAWMNYAGGIISAVGSALPSLEALAAAQAAAAVTKTALSPWTVVSGIAAVTSIIAAMAQLPKFATGGVVPGNALSGDNVLIRANSGEVVLTKQQANNIGSALAGLGGTVKFKIEGGDLVGVLNNHNSITSRRYGH